MSAPLLLYGRDHVRYGQCEIVADPASRGWAAISVGSDPRSPSLASKGSPAFPNEDALLLATTESAALLAVADGHRGIGTSHGLIGGLAAIAPRLLDGDIDLAQAIAALDLEAVHDASASTLVAVRVDRVRGRGRGVFRGDSSAAVVGGSACRRLTWRNVDYVRPPRVGECPTFEIALGAREGLLLFTDGVDECHYGRPATSVGPSHIAALHERHGGEPGAFVRALARAALGGVDGNPGGQDNLAIVYMPPREVAPAA